MGKGFFSNLSTPFTGIIEEALDTWLYYIRMYVRKRLVGPGIQSESHVRRKNYLYRYGKRMIHKLSAVILILI